MPFDPSKPLNNSVISAPELRSQFTGLNDGLQQRATLALLAAEIAGTSNVSNAVGNLGLGVSDPPAAGEVQAIADKLDELINALRR